jgi:hypothetical protein
LLPAEHGRSAATPLRHLGNQELLDASYPSLQKGGIVSAQTRALIEAEPRFATAT